MTFFVTRLNITWVVKLGFTLLFISQLLSCTSVKNPSDVPEYSGRLFIDIQSDPRFYFQSPFQLQGTREEGILSIETALGMRILNIIWRKNYVAIERNGQLYPYHSWESMIQEQTQLGELPIDGLFTWLENGIFKLPDWTVLHLSKQQLSIQKNSPPKHIKMQIWLTP